MPLSRTFAATCSIYGAESPRIIFNACTRLSKIFEAGASWPTPGPRRTPHVGMKRLGASWSFCATKCQLHTAETLSASLSTFWILFSVWPIDQTEFSYDDEATSLLHGCLLSRCEICSVIYSGDLEEGRVRF